MVKLKPECQRYNAQTSTAKGPASDEEVRRRQYAAFTFAGAGTAGSVCRCCVVELDQV